MLSTKVGRYKDGVFDFSAARVTRSVDVRPAVRCAVLCADSRRWLKESMARLGVNFIDILQCHDIEFGDLDQIVGETLPGTPPAQTFHTIA